MSPLLLFGEEARDVNFPILFLSAYPHSCFGSTSSVHSVLWDCDFYCHVLIYPTCWKSMSKPAAWPWWLGHSGITILPLCLSTVVMWFLFAGVFLFWSVAGGSRLSLSVLMGFSGCHFPQLQVWETWGKKKTQRTHHSTCLGPPEPLAGFYLFSVSSMIPFCTVFRALLCSTGGIQSLSFHVH